jgi:hypothetical protein
MNFGITSLGETDVSESEVLLMIVKLRDNSTERNISKNIK